MKIIISIDMIQKRSAIMQKPAGLFIKQ